MENAGLDRRRAEVAADGELYRRKRIALAALSLPPGSGDVAFRHFHRPVPNCVSITAPSPNFAPAPR